MSADPNKKSARTFQCRDVLWETFEQMARELECSIDYLINESMKQYARQRSYSPRTPFPGGQRTEGGAPGSGPPLSTAGLPAPPPSPPPPAPGGYPPAPGGYPPAPGATPAPPTYSGAPAAPPPMMGGMGMPGAPPAPPPMMGGP